MDHLRQAVCTVHLRKNGVMTDEHLETLMKLKRKDGTAHHADEMTGPGFRKEEMWEAIRTLESSHAELLEAAQELLSWPSMSYAGGKSRDVAKAIAKLQEAIKSATEAKP